MLRLSTGWIFILIIFIAFSFLLFNVTAEVQEVKTISDVLNERANLEEIVISKNSLIYDRNGDVVSEVFRDANRIYLPYEEIPSVIIDAFIATEDQRFFEHKGYDAIGIGRALLQNARQDGIEEGGSTLTQQLARNLFLTHDQTYNRKVSELLYAHELEKNYTKEEIIELYINTIYFNNGLYGIEAASRYYFNKPSERLTIAEAAFLSAVPNNPSHYDPINNSEQTKLRQEWILTKMFEASYVTEEQFEEALEEPIVLNVKQKTDLYPDYVTYIHQEFKELVAEAEGYKEKMLQATSDAERTSIEQALQERVRQLLASGIHIETSLDPFLQNLAVKAIHRQVPDSDVQASAVMIDHNNNEIVAITGGKNHKKFDFHRGFQNPRQPGSAIKPLLVYAPYLDTFNVSTQSSINADNVCFGEYCPRNYGGSQYGMVSLTTALKHSYNTPAVSMLDQVGVDTAFQYVEKFGFSSLDQRDYRLPSALGGLTYGVTPLELTSAYTTFANDGTYHPSYGIRSVTDQDGTILYSWELNSVDVWSKETNDKMRSLLSEVLKSGTARRAQVPASYSGGKTGTTNNYYDLWFVGLTDEYTTGVWVGKDKQASIEHLNDKAPHLLIWQELMR
ncbi:transglycosylase domain-containing protein [Halalkalibacter kiskunsagensis]|uniref:Transglycosylase domain-containing protein n=1 Tax=Halalkalibacter kiskunsagensis TaxID=1548599 RepID=A0ABV6KBY4_9BACI